MKKFVLPLLLCLLAGCTTTHHVLVNVGDAGSAEYSVYMNGEKVCESSDNCYVDVGHFRKKVFLEARKDSVVYGQLLVAKGTTNNPNAVYENLDALQKSMDAAEFTSSIDDPVLAIGATMVVPPAVFLVLFVPSNTSKFPDEVRIPVATPNSSSPYPWDKPERSDGLKVP